jgi:Protein of unknown function (DUF3352)
MDEQPPPDQPSESLPPAPPEGSMPPPEGSPLPQPAYGPSAFAVPEPPPATNRRRGRAMIAGVVAFALLLGGGAAVAFIKMRGSGEKLLSKVPASSDVVFTAYLNPSAGQKANLFLLSSKFPALGSEQQLATRFEQGLDTALGTTGTGLRHQDLSWVGDQVAFVLDVPSSIGVNFSLSYAALVDTKDEDAARTTLQKLEATSNDGSWTDSTVDGVAVSSNGQEADAVFDGTAVVANSLDEMSRIIAAAHGHQPALEGSSQLQAATAGLPDGKLALLYVNLKDVLPLLEQDAGSLMELSTTPPDLSTLQALTGMAMTVSVQPDGVALDAQVAYDPSKLTDEQKAQMNDPAHPNPLLSSIPVDALAVFTGEHLDTQLKAVTDQLATASPETATMLAKLGVTGDDGLISTLSGDEAVEVTPEGANTSAGEAIILGTKDPAAMQRAFEKLSQGVTSLARQQTDTGGGTVVPFSTPSSWVKGDYHGVTITTFRMKGFPDISYAVVDDRGVIGSSAAQVFDVVDAVQHKENISSSAAYNAAIGSVPSSGGSFYVDIEGTMALIRAMLPPDEQAAFDSDVRPNLAPLKSFVEGSEGDATHSHVRFFLRIG